MTLTSIYLLSAFLFACGVACMLIRRNAIQVLMGIELALNAASLNFAAVSRMGVNRGIFDGAAVSGQFFSLVIIVVAACEAAVALAIIFAMFHRFKSIRVTDAASLKE